MASNEREKEIYKVTIVGSFVNFLLLIFKFVSGIVGHSAAMIADAVHSLSDFVTDILVLVFVKISSKPADKDHRYGHGKFETLATAIIGAVLLAVVVIPSIGGQLLFGDSLFRAYVPCGAVSAYQSAGIYNAQEAPAENSSRHRSQ